MVKEAIELRWNLLKNNARKLRLHQNDRCKRLPWSTPLMIILRLRTKNSFSEIDISYSNGLLKFIATQPVLIRMDF